jgi:AraC family transcriptional regulator, positive regulator of tynA and feaB
LYQSFPVAAVPERERFSYFQSVVETVFCPMQVRPGGSSEQSFRGSVEATNLGAIRLARVATSACVVRRFGGDVARLADAPYLVKFQLKGESYWSQRGREIHLRPGDFVIASMAEPYSLRFRDDFEMPVLALSPRTMQALTPDPDQFLALRMSGDDADCGLLSSFVAQVVARMSRLKEPMIARVEANILDLLGGVLGARAGRGVLSGSQQLTLIKAFIERHLHDRRLGPGMIAAAFNISTRCIHSLFHSEPMSLGRHINSLRIEASRRLMLEQPARSLTDIALDCGFYDLSHLSRCFRNLHRITPREYRMAIEAGGGCPP